MERDVDPGERDSRKAPLKLDVALRFLLLARSFVTLINDRVQHFLDFLDRERLRELRWWSAKIIYRSNALKLTFAMSIFSTFK